MDEQTLLKTAVIISFAGLAGLIYMSSTTETTTKITYITPDYVGNTVKICGTVTSASISKNNHIFLEIKDGTGSIKAVIFNKTAARLSPNPYKIERGESVCLTGYVDTYMGETEIITRKIENV